jgi:hypothetical protein
VKIIFWRISIGVIEYRREFGLLEGPSFLFMRRPLLLQWS